MADLASIEAGWDEAAHQDAMFNILTDPGRANGGWTAEDFFAHGEREIDLAMARLNLRRKGRALDFGCGLGRLTQALANHFKRVDGADVSPEMVRQARGYNHHPGRVEYHRTGKRLPWRAGTFDFVYSMIVLQHMPQPLQEGYVREFFRVLKLGGVAMFEIPDGIDAPHALPWLSMYAVPRATVERWIREASATLDDVELIEEPSEWNCYRYTATCG